MEGKDQTTRPTHPDHGGEPDADSALKEAAAYAQDRSKSGLRVLFTNILCNFMLFAGKLIAGFFMKSAAVVADAFNNLSDTVSNIIGIVGVRISVEPADEAHPYGHGRAEYLTSFVISLIIIALGVYSMYESLGKLIRGERTTFDLLPFIFLIISIGVKLFMAYFNKKRGEELDSTILKTAGADALSDVLVTSSTVAVILLERVVTWPLDGAAGLIVGFLVIKTGCQMACQSADYIIGRAPDPKMVREVTQCILMHDGVKQVHELLLHSYGPGHMDGSAHIELSKNLTLEQAHAIADRIEADVRRRWGIHMVIHVDPV